MDWFERLTGFRETDYTETRAKLAVAGNVLTSKVNGKSYNTGRFELLSLAELRSRVRPATQGRLRVTVPTGDVRAMHREPEFAGALFQVASQFNMLEMVCPRVTPEAGIGRYEGDLTQGPACAIAAGAATIYRNYFVDVGGEQGQTSDRQIDGLADVGAALARHLNLDVGDLWKMQNGYALCSASGLSAIDSLLGTLSPLQQDELRALLKFGVHFGAEVTDVPAHPGPAVSQIFCSALPVAYTKINIDPARWAAFAQLVLDAAYEATMLTAVLNAQQGGSNVVCLTMLGGGEFGNDPEWIAQAIRHALDVVAGYDLDVRIISFKAVRPEVRLIAQDYS